MVVIHKWKCLIYHCYVNSSQYTFSKEGWVPNNWCFWIVVLEKTLESPLDSKKIKLVYSKWNQPWIGRTDAEAEAPILWPLDAKSWLIGPWCQDKIEGRRRRGKQSMRWLDGITESMHMSLSKLREIVDREAWYAAVHRITRSWTWLSIWTTKTVPTIARPGASYECYKMNISVNIDM